MSELVFYTNPMSRGRIVRWMLEEVGQPYRTELLDYGATMKAADYLAINPMGKVPAIVHDGRVVTECAAICAYLAEAFPDAGLSPRPDERADYYRWLFFAAGPIETAVLVQTLGATVPDDRKAMTGYGSMDAVVQGLERMLEGRDFVTGDRFTAADVYVGSQIRWGLAFGTLPARPALAAYGDRLGQRPALIRATEIDEALTPPRPG